MAHTNPPIRYGLLAGALSLFTLVYVATAHPFSMSFKSVDSRWQVVVDGVMGGLSTGVIEDTSNGIMFSGDLSLENNGGFSQIRTPIRQGSLDGADGIEIEVRGDGRNYIFDARVANMRVMAGSFQHKFDTVSEEWTTVRLPFTDFKFHYFGRLMENVGAIDPDMINSLGVTLADYNPGEFGLEIRAVRGYVEGDEDYDARLARLGEQLGLIVAVEEEPAPDLSGLYAGRLDRLAAELTTREKSQRSQRMTMSASDSSRVMELCVLAIDRGAPLFNQGQREACASIYEVTLASIYALGGESMDEDTRTMLFRSLRDGRRMHDASDRAWHYRAAIDALIRTFSGRV